MKYSIAVSCMSLDATRYGHISYKQAPFKGRSQVSNNDLLRSWRGLLEQRLAQHDNRTTESNYCLYGRRLLSAPSVCSGRRPGVGRPAVRPGQRMGRRTSESTRLPVRQGARAARRETLQSGVAATRRSSSAK